MTRLPVSIAAASAAFALTLVQAAVLAKPASHDPRAVEVTYGDLDLTNASDAAALYERLTAAAREACDARDARGARGLAQVQECVARAIADAVVRVDSDALTALARARDPRAGRG